MNPQHGFTLMEIVATLVLVGIMATVVGLGLVTGMQGYLLSRENAEITQKAQMALTRLGKEISDCYNCDEEQLSFENTQGQRELFYDPSAGEVRINGHTLIDQVSSFVIEPPDPDKLIRIEFTLEHRQGGGSQTFSTKIYPRNSFN